jgi:AraC-like DNA-binding protein
VNALPEILRRKVLPWAREFDHRHLVIARQRRSEVAVPDHIEVTPHTLRSRRTPTRGPRFYGNVSTITARWPEDGIQEKKVAQLACVVNGKADLTFGSYALSSSAGYFFFIPPGVPHPGGGKSFPHLSLQAQRKKNSCDLIWFGPWGRTIRCYVCHSHGTKHSHSARENYFILQARARDTFDLLTEEASGRGENHEDTCWDLLRAFLTIADRELHSGHVLHLGASTFNEEAIGSEEEGDAIERAQNYVRSHLGEPLGIDKVAQQIHMSRALFTRRFREQTGQSFNEFITHCRIQEASTLLRESDWAISLIASNIGFRSPAHFTRLFQDRTGATPTEFRATHRDRQARESR